MRGCKADLRTYQPAPAVATEEDAASDFPGARRLAPFNTLSRSDKFTFDIKKQESPNPGTQVLNLALSASRSRQLQSLRSWMLLRPALLRKQHPRN